jgi:hypothetical protein
VNWSAELFVLVPPGVVTVISTAPKEPGGATAVIWLELLTVKVATELPKSTAVAPVKLVPVTVTEVPPVLCPELGLTAVTVGGGGTVYVKRSEELVALVPPEVVTVMSTVPSALAGEVAVIWVGPLTVKAAAVVPNLTAVAPVKPVPVTVTAVAPVLGPEEGLTELTVGRGGGV